LHLHIYRHTANCATGPEVLLNLCWTAEMHLKSKKVYFKAQKIRYKICLYDQILKH